MIPPDAAPLMNGTALTISATDGYALGATRYGPPSPAAAVVIAPATGVKRRLYDGYAQFLAARGFGVLTWDWRGTGDSRPATLRGFSATMRQWGERDLAGAIDWARTAWPVAQLIGFGHSFGGQALGLAPNADRFAALVTVAAQSGYYGHWPRGTRWRYALLWHAVMPALSHAFGRFPGRRVGWGEDLPKGVALEWARWCRTPEYLGDWSGHARITAPILSLGFADDTYAPEAAIRALHERYGSTTREHDFIRPADVGADRIGHFGFFRPAAPALWDRTAEWMERTLAI